MRHKWLFVALLLGMLFWLALRPSFQGPKFDKNGVAGHLVVSSNKREQVGETPSKVMVKEPVSASEAENIENLIYQELSQSWFNEDPYLDARAAKSVLWDCKNINFEGRLIKRQDYSAVKHLVEKHKQQCEIWFERYSTLQENLESIDKIPTTTKLGELSKNYSLESQLNNFNKSISIFELAHQEGDLETLNSASSLMRVPFNSGLKRPEQEVIGGDMADINRLARITLELLRCEKGSGYECSASSQTMMHNCVYIPEACGLTYPQWTEVFLTPGMKMDVEALKAYYQQNM